MGVIEAMDYRFENPGQRINVDVKIAESLMSQERTKEEIENFENWASVSRERENIDLVLNNYKQQVNESQFDKVR